MCPLRIGQETCIVVQYQPTSVVVLVVFILLRQVVLHPITARLLTVTIVESQRRQRTAQLLPLAAASCRASCTTCITEQYRDGFPSNMFEARDRSPLPAGLSQRSTIAASCCT